MTSIFAVGFAGLVLGLRHAFEPDHLAAVGSMVSRDLSPRRAATIGAVWGGGHAVALFAFGALILVLRLSLPSWLDIALEGFVGLMLIGLGIKAIVGTFKVRKNQSAHPFKVGVVHGLAGTGAAVLLATATIQDDRLGIVFLGLFGVGAALGMAAMASVLGIPIRRASLRRAGAKVAPILLGACSVGIGIWWFAKALTA